MQEMEFWDHSKNTTEVDIEHLINYILVLFEYCENDFSIFILSKQNFVPSEDEVACLSCRNENFDMF